MDEQMLTAYLRRIGVPRPASLDAAALRDLHRAHQMAVPFENLSIHLSEPISLAQDDLLGKIVTRRRGGFCYELNGADGLSPPLDHLALLVRTADDDRTWLADVGFGKHAVFALRYDSRDVQADPAGDFLLADAAGGDVDVLADGEPQYRIEPRPMALDDFVPTCWWQQTSPRSHFTAETICSRLTGDGRISLSGRTLIRTGHGARAEERLADDDAVLAAYRDHFGIVLDRLPAAAAQRHQHQSAATGEHEPLTTGPSGA
jgi:N-hydroxyarylamine O-acetyltransferase